MNEIDWFEYERQKKKIQNIGLTSKEYERAIDKIVKDLEAEADKKAEEQAA